MPDNAFSVAIILNNKWWYPKMSIHRSESRWIIFRFYPGLFLLFQCRGMNLNEWNFLLYLLYLKTYILWLKRAYDYYKLCFIFKNTLNNRIIWSFVILVILYKEISDIFSFTSHFLVNNMFLLGSQWIFESLKGKCHVEGKVWKIIQIFIPLYL